MIYKFGRVGIERRWGRLSGLSRLCSGFIGVDLRHLYGVLLAIKIREDPPDLLNPLPFLDLLGNYPGVRQNTGINANSLGDKRMSNPIRIAMWSGPRNISTAMMRAWENRSDTIVVDEPLYAHYLFATGMDHPVSAEIIAHDETDWRVVVQHLCADRLPPGKEIYYQKHMTHHILATMDLDWTDRLLNCFLIREPREVITSYIKIRPDVTLEDIGFSQQRRIFDHVRAQTGEIPPVIDTRDVLEDPRRVLGLLCDRIGVPFDEQMLHWPPGPRHSDGIWAPHWYSAVWASTGFEPYRPKAATSAGPFTRFIG